MSTNIDNNFLKNNLKALLQEKMWLLEERLGKIRQASPYKLTDAHTRILATLRGESLTIAEVARKLTVSRQAVHKLVTELIKMQLLVLEPIPGNARDKRIRFTPEGEALKKAAALALLKLEQEVETAIGRENLQILKNLLSRSW